VETSLHRRLALRIVGPTTKFPAKLISCLRSPATRLLVMLWSYAQIVSLVMEYFGMPDWSEFDALFERVVKEFDEAVQSGGDKSE
jgi:hypothetical protein